MSNLATIDTAKVRLILDRLEQIERSHDIRILHAPEAGSRGWGFDSAQSDFDVRFIYVHRPAWYFQILGRSETRKDSIVAPTEGDLDIGGWELGKTLGLFKSGNATVNEWLDSPVVYRTHAGFIDRVRPIMAELHLPVPAFFHYLRMGQGNFREYAQQPGPKSFLYALRPALSARWLADGHGPVPMRFDEICARTIADPALQAAVARLVQAKRSGADVPGQPEPALVAHVTTLLAQLNALALTDHRHRDFAPLDKLLYEQVKDFGQAG